MKRHDTHILSDESDIERKKDDSHKYNLNDSKSSYTSSEEKFFLKEPQPKNPLYINNLLIKNNNNENNIPKDNNTSIISSKELEDIFCNEDNNLIRQKKKKAKKRKYFIKLRKIRLNNDEILYHCLTYDFPLKNVFIDDKIHNKNRNCVSLNNLIKAKNKNNVSIKMNERENHGVLKEKEILYFFYNNDNEGNKKLKRFIDIINNSKMKLLKISNSNFSIKTKQKSKRKKKYPLISSINNKNNRNQNYKSNSNKNKYNVNEYLDEDVRKRKVKYSRIVSHLNSNKLKKTNKLILNKDKKLIFKNNYTSNNALKNNYWKTPNQSMSLNSKNNNEKNALLFNLYCGELKKGNKKFQRIKSTESLFNIKQNEAKESKETKETTWVRMNNYLDYIKYAKINDNEKQNRSLITKLYKMKEGDNNFNHLNIHFGKNDNCPLCQIKEKKNEKNLHKIGIISMASASGGKDIIQNSWQSRRVYSALSKVINKNHKNIKGYNLINGNNNINKNINKENTISYCNDVNKKYTKIDLIRSTNALTRKLDIKKSNHEQFNFSTNNRFFKVKFNQ